MLMRGRSWKGLWRVSERSLSCTISSIGATSHIDFDFDSKLMDLNAQLERAVKGGPKKYIDAGSVSKNLNNIKSSLDQAIRDLTVHSVSQSLGTAESCLCTL